MFFSMFFLLDSIPISQLYSTLSTSPTLPFLPSFPHLIPKVRLLHILLDFCYTLSSFWPVDFLLCFMCKLCLVAVEVWQNGRILSILKASSFPFVGGLQLMELVWVIYIYVELQLRVFFLPSKCLGWWALWDGLFSLIGFAFYLLDIK